MATYREMTAGPALPLIFNFTMPLLWGNLLQQTYSLVDAAIVGKFLGINALAAVGSSSSVDVYKRQDGESVELSPVLIFSVPEVRSLFFYF